MQSANEAFPLLFPRKVLAGGRSTSSPASSELCFLNTRQSSWKRSNSRVNVRVISEQALIIVNRIRAFKAQVRSSHARIRRFGAPSAKALFSFSLRCQLLLQDLAPLSLLMTWDELGEFAAGRIIVAVESAVQALDSTVRFGRRRSCRVDRTIATKCWCAGTGSKLFGERLRRLVVFAPEIDA